MRKLKTALVLGACVLLCGNRSIAKNNFFTAVDRASLSENAPIKTVRNMSVVQLDERAMRSYLLAAPLEFHNNGKTLPLDIPMPDGTIETFQIVESPILSDRVAALNPEIKTYAGNGTQHKGAIVRLSLTPAGFNAIILNIGNNNVYFQKYSRGLADQYFSYFTKDAVLPKGAKLSSCGFNPAGDNSLINPSGVSDQDNRTANKGTATGANIITYRLAMPADAEFTGNNGGTSALGFAAVVAYVNRMTAFYRNELSVSFTIVSDQTDVYTNAATDPFDNNNQGLMLNQNRDYLNITKYTSAFYDIGHVWGYVGGSGGGVAALGSVCTASQKGRGTSGEGDTSVYAQVFMDQLLFHEVGHQFGMNHSYNSSVPVCTTRNPGTSVEPGSGATIMSYGFTCNNSDPGFGLVGEDDYFTTDFPLTGPILQFHTTSYQEGATFISTAGCGVTTSTGNTPPVVTMPASYTIPVSTPFSLTGSATDVDGDALTYCWEGTNVGTSTPTATTLANTAEPPFFRSYLPSASGTRIYPVIDSILNGVTKNYSKGDKLPSVGITTTHNLTVRDNHASGGGVQFASVNIVVNGAIGPFLETTNLSGSYVGGLPQLITWSVNGTNIATPNVKISLSTDGGYTFPTVLAASAPNIGLLLVTLPSVSTTAARIKVEAVGNIFFDISNNNFTITPSPLPLTMLSFDARLQYENNVLLQWTTADEKNIESYDVEMARSNGGFLFKGNVKSNATGNSNKYRFAGLTLTEGTYYFRLKIREKNGGFSYSATRSLNVGLNGTDVQVYPSPTSGILQITLPSAMEGSSLSLVNNIGQVVKTFISTKEVTRSIDISSLSAGVYILEIVTPNKIVTRKKIVKE